MNEDINTLDDVQESAVEIQEAEEVTEELEPTEEVTDSTEEVATPKQSAEENAKYAKARREEKARADALAKEKAELEAKLNLLEKAVKGYGYEGSAQELADQLIAAQREMTPEQVKAEREAMEAEIQNAVSKHPLVAQAQAQMVQLELEKELTKIRRINPNIKSIDDLAGDPKFDKLVIEHGVPLSEAYELLHPIHTKTTKDTKAHLTGINTGDVASDGMVEIPSSEIGFYKENFPDKKPSELKEIYNRIIKRQKGE